MTDSEYEPPVIRKDSNFKHSRIYSFHSELPQFKFTTLPKQFNESPIRPSIMTILREGIFSKDSNDQLRYALSAQEIKELLSNSPLAEVKNVSYTNLYFHLKKMLEARVIQIVAYVVERNHRIAYYGRTAKLIFFSDPSTQLQNYKSSFEELANLLRILHPEIDTKIFDQYPAKYLADEEEKAVQIAKWMAKNEDVISKNGLNINQIYKAMKILIDYSDIKDEAIKEIVELFMVE